MSTRCNIIVETNWNGKKSFYTQLYHHHDGYPSGVGADLDKFITEWNGKDIPYCGEGSKKWYLNFLAKMFVDYVHEMDSTYEDEDLVMMHLHGDIEWLYRVCVDIVDGKAVITKDTIKVPSGKLNEIEKGIFDEWKDSSVILGWSLLYTKYE